MYQKFDDDGIEDTAAEAGITNTVVYWADAVQVSMHNGLTNTRDDFELCVRAENVELPRSGYFGVSAATGALAGTFFCCDTFLTCCIQLIDTTDAV